LSPIGSLNHVGDREEVDSYDYTKSLE